MFGEVSAGGRFGIDFSRRLVAIGCGGGGGGKFHGKEGEFASKCQIRVPLTKDNSMNDYDGGVLMCWRSAAATT